MKILNESERDALGSLITYLEKGGSPGNQIDERTAQTLNKIFGESCGFKCGCPGTLLEGLRDAPIVTLLKIMTCDDTGLIVLPDNFPMLN